MPQPALDTLPPPPSGRTGWPWTEAPPSLPPAMPNGSAWPRISIVTPSYNQGEFIEETIRSILLQGYPNLEYIIIDGGSTDGTVEIIKKYEPWLTYWVSEQDNGQAHAINKGIQRCTGEIFNWINSDDYLTPGAAKSIALAFSTGEDVAAGCVLNIQAGEAPILVKQAHLSGLNMLIGRDRVLYHQPGFWVRLPSLRQINPIDESLHYSFDWDLHTRYLSSFPAVKYVDEILVHFRLHPGSKTVNEQVRFSQERIVLLERCLEDPDMGSMHEVARVALRERVWWHEFRLVNESHRSSFYKALTLFLKSLIDPRIRWSRFTFGVIHKWLLAGLRSSFNSGKRGT